METREVPLTQERLSAMLGVGRSYVSRVVRSYKSENILTVKRGRMIIHDADRLAAKSCGCNDIVKSHFEAVLGEIYPGAE